MLKSSTRQSDEYKAAIKIFGAMLISQPVAEYLGT